jgi:hypothetical protein
MKILRETALLFRNTVLVTSAVLLGIWAASAFSLPLWFWYPCLLPAGYLFLKLSDTQPPIGWKLLGFFSIWPVTYSLYLGLIFPHIPVNCQTVGFGLVLGINLKLIFLSADWLERRFASQSQPVNHAASITHDQ